jgi:TRAP-type transport system periplasmic protein
VFDFPFLWRDWPHVHRVVDSALGTSAADYLAGSVRMRPLAWGDSFGFRHVITRSRDVSEPGQLAGLKLRTIQSAIYVKAIELMGASPTPMAFGEVYTSLQTGVIDGYEHDASTTLAQRFFEVAHHMTRTGHIAGVLGLWASTAALERLPADARALLERAGPEAARQQREAGAAEDARATAELRERGMTIREIDVTSFRKSATTLWEDEARTLGVGSWLQLIRA